MRHSPPRCQLTAPLGAFIFLHIVTAVPEPKGNVHLDGALTAQSLLLRGGALAFVERDAVVGASSATGGIELQREQSILTVAATMGTIPAPELAQSKIVWCLAAFMPVFLWLASCESTAWQLVVPGWMALGILMNVVNKVAATSFQAPFLLVLLQMIFGSVWILSTEHTRLSYKSWRDLAKWTPVPCIFAFVLCSSLLAFQQVSLSSIIICRNVLPLITFIIEKAAFNLPAKVEPAVVISLSAALGGVMLYSYSTPTTASTRTGLVFVFANCACCAMDRLIQSRLLKSDTFGASLSLCSLMNNTLGIVPILIIAFVTGEVSTWGAVLRDASPAAGCWVLMSCVCGFSLGYLGLKTQKSVTATTSLMLQNLVKVLLIFIGVVGFGDRFSPLGCVGCAVAIAGGLWYSHARLPAETLAVKKADTNSR